MNGKYLDTRIISSLIEQLQNIKQGIENKNVEPIEDAFALIGELKNQDKDTEEKIIEAYGYIDKIIAGLDKEEIGRSTEDCETVYKRTIFWDGLDSSSQKFLCIADFLYSYLQEIKKDDFSPAVIEFCRTLENELFFGIFKEFIINIIESHGDRTESLLVGDVSKEKTKELAYRIIAGKAGQDLFLTLGQMQPCLYGLSRQDFSNSFVLGELRDYMLNNFTLDISTESDIALSLKDITDKYRNKAVHPDILDIECVKESKKAVTCYLALINRYKSKSARWQQMSTVSSNKKIMPIALPSGAKWEDITIEFADEHNVKIKCKGKTIRSDYKDMGFEDKKIKRPDVQWELLRDLAKNNGEISWGNYPSNKIDMSKVNEAFGNEFAEEGDQPYSVISGTSANVRKKRKEKLAKSLKAVFSIDGDPFFPYKKVKAYKIRIKLIN